MSDETYNGWTGKGNKASAYATWRVRLELVDEDWIRDTFSAGRPEERELEDFLEEEVTSIVCMSVDDENAEKVATQYAMVFLEDVSWQEIAENILSDWDD
jgi:hypothetical protein